MFYFAIFVFCISSTDEELMLKFLQNENVSVAEAKALIVASAEPFLKLQRLEQGLLELHHEKLKSIQTESKREKRRLEIADKEVQENANDGEEPRKREPKKKELRLALKTKKK